MDTFKNRSLYVFEFIRKKDAVTGEPFVNLIDIWYDHSTSEVYTPYFINRDYLSEQEVKIGTWTDELPKNSLKLVLSPIKLIEDNQAGRLRGKLKEIASKVDEEDNPILVLIKFKQ